MKLYYDLHIHSVLSPCGDEDMTPNNIVNMAKLLGLDIIAVTDHNSAGNIRAVKKAGMDKIKVVPGIEITTAEEVHTLCYFSEVEAAEDMGDFLERHLQKIKNRPEIFGRQLLMDENDFIIGEKETLLISAVDLDIYSVQKEVKKRGGIFVPAHIDKSSYSILSNLGFFPPDLDVDGVEITKDSIDKYKPDYDKYSIISNSDAHFLGDISEADIFLELNDESAQNLYEFLCRF